MTKLPDEFQILITEGPRKLTFYNRPIPEVGDNDVLIKTRFSGVSHGTEMNVYRGLAPHFRSYFDRGERLFIPRDLEEKSPIPERGYFISADLKWQYPFAYGYANVGEVIHVGSLVTHVVPGDLVFTYRQHATYTVQPAERVYKLPQLTNPETGIFVANINTALNGVMDSNLKLGDYAVIFGQGIVGLLVTQWAKKAGVHQLVTVDKLKTRRELSLQLGADMSLDPDQVDIAKFMRELTAGRGADVVFEVSGNYGALQQAIRTAAPNTNVITMGFYSGDPSALNLGAEFHHNRITLKGSLVDLQGPDLSATHSFDRRVRFVCESLPNLNLQPLISTMIPFEDAPQGYDMIDKHSDQLTQVILCYK